ncbi:HTH-type transcriptional repressor CytR [Comamonadaceae bacterium OS-1]|nr:HTH-type transcriptional repressor CytR [Comamonadaceae bacterium OS-1]
MPKTTPTLAEIATAAGVSTMTASRAINDQPGVSRSTRDAILKLAHNMGYVANRSAQKLSGGRSRVIGLLASDLGNAFTSSLVSGAVQAVAAAGNEVLIYSLLDRAQRPNDNVLQLLQQFTDGVIAILPYQFGFVESLSAAQVPVVTIDQHTEHAEFPSIAADSYGGARSAMQHLAELGHRRIAFITGDERMNSARDRHRAYDDAVAILGLERDPALVLPGDYSLGSGRAAAQQLLALPVRPTALFAANDLSAFGAMSVLQTAGLRVPQDMSVVGFDDLEAASLVHPGLTTVRQPINEMGRAAANTLLALIAGLNVATQQVSLPTELVVRASTAVCKRVVKPPKK